MARLFRASYTRTVPPDAKIVTLRGKPHARYTDKRGTAVTAPLTKDGTRCRFFSSTYTGQYRNIDGKLISVPLFTDRMASEQRLAELVRLEDRRQSGLSDRFTEHGPTPLMQHIAEWGQSLRDDGASKSHAGKTVSQVRRIVEACGFKVMGDLSASRVQGFLADLRKDRPASVIDHAKETYTRADLAELIGVKPSAIGSLLRRHRLTDGAKGEGKARRYKRSIAEALVGLRVRGASIRTSNAYLAAIKQFCRWLVQDRRAVDSPLAHLTGGNVKLDRRHDRRILDEAELRSVIATARQSSVVFRGLTGPDRAMIYAVACASGFRAGELTVLSPSSFSLEAPSPEVTLGATYTKNHKTAVQPLPVDLAGFLADYLAGRPIDTPIWAGTWHERAADMLRIELDVCGIPYIVQGPEGPLYADFHALRHSFVALLDRAGATLKEAMQLARHSDPKLTMAVYGRARLQDLAGAVERLPSLLAQAPEPSALRATGTDGEILLISCAQDDEARGSKTTNDDECTPALESAYVPEVHTMTRIDDDRGDMTTIDENGPSRIRTCNQGIMSPLGNSTSPDEITPCDDALSDDSNGRCNGNDRDADLQRVLDA